MDLQILFQWHKLLHIILPIIIILAFHKKSGLSKVCIAILIIGLLKETYDTVIQIDPLWVSFLDVASNVVGIALGIMIANIKEQLRQ